MKPDLVMRIRIQELVDAGVSVTFAPGFASDYECTLYWPGRKQGDHSHFGGASLQAATESAYRGWKEVNP